jgi:hypothetical protein
MDFLSRLNAAIAHRRPAFAAVLLDLWYPGLDRPAGVFESSIGNRARNFVEEHASEVRQGDRDHDVYHQCWLMAPAWLSALQTNLRAVEFEIIGGEGIEEQDYGQGQVRPAPPEEQSGYRDGTGHVQRHYWLIVGSHLALFDPTAHQWDERGGFDLARYVVDGQSFTTWRAIRRQRGPA